MIVQTLAGIAISIGCLLVIYNWYFLYVTRRFGQFVSPIPLVGYVLLCLGLLGFEQTRPYFWLGVIIDYGTLTLIFAIPNLLREKWLASSFNLLHRFHSEMHGRTRFQVHSSYLLSLFLLLGMTLPIISLAESAEPWGTRSYTVEKKIYDELVKKANQEIRKAQHRKEQNSSQLRIILGDISGYEYQEFEKWYNSKAGNRPPVLKSDLPWAKGELDDARQSYFIYAEGRTSPDNPKFGAGVRNSLWPAHLKMLNTQIKYLDLQAWDEEFRRKAGERYVYSLYTQMYENAITGMQYVMKKHAEQFFADLADCAVRVVVQASAKSFLPVMYKKQGMPYPAEFKTISMPGYGTNSIVNSKGNVISCLENSVRSSIVNATVSGIRFSFVSRVVKTWHVPEEIAEYWWSKMINPGDSEGSPWEPQHRPMYDRITQGVFNALKRVNNDQNILAHKKDWFKFAWENEIRKRLKKGANKEALEWLKKWRKSSNNKYERVQLNTNAARRARYNGKIAVEKEASVKWLESADWFILVFNTTFQATYLNVKQSQFGAAAKPVVDEYKRIVACLKKQKMSTRPQTVLMIYKLTKKQDVADFFARCDEKMPEQITEQSMEQGQELTRKLYRLLELARDIHGNDYSSCQSTLDSVADLLPQVDPENTISASDLALRLAGFKESATTIVSNAQEAEVRGKIIAEAKTKVDQIVAQACQNSSPVANTTDSENSVARQAQHYSTTSSELLSEIEVIYQNTEMLATLVVDEAAVLAAASRETAPLSTEDTQHLLVEIEENLEGTESSAKEMAQIVSDAQAEYKKQVSVLNSITTDTAKGLLADSREWLTEIEQLSDELRDCRGQLQAAMNNVSENNRQEQAAKEFISRDDVTVLAEQAAKAVQKLNATLDLAKKDDNFVQLKMDETKLCLDRVKMQGLLGQAQIAGKKALAACDTAKQKAIKATGQLSELASNIDVLTSEAKKHSDNLLKLEAMSHKISGYRNDAKTSATNARRDQGTAKQLKIKACQRLREIKSSQSVNNIEAVLAEIQGAVSSCKSLSRKVHQSATSADGSASACKAISIAMEAVVVSPMASIDGQALKIKADIDALDAISITAKVQAVKIKTSSGQAKKILASSQSIASRLQNNQFSQTVVGEMSVIVKQIDAMYGKILACSDEIKTQSGELIARQAELQSAEKTLSNRTQRLNSALQSDDFSDKSTKDSEAAGNFAEMAGWSVEGMNVVLSSVASCQAAAEIILSKAQAAQATCQANVDCADSDDDGSENKGNLFTSSGGEEDTHDDSDNEANLFSSSGGEDQSQNTNNIDVIPQQENSFASQCAELINNITGALRNKQTDSAQSYTNMAVALGCDINTGYVDQSVAQIKEQERRRKEQLDRERQQLERERQQQLAEQERQRQENVRQQQVANTQRNMEAIQTMVNVFSQAMENKRNRDKPNRNNTAINSGNNGWKALSERTSPGINKHVTPPVYFPGVNNPGMPGTQTSNGSKNTRPGNKSTGSKKPAYLGKYNVTHKTIKVTIHDKSLRYGRNISHRDKVGESWSSKWSVTSRKGNKIQICNGAFFCFTKPETRGNSLSTSYRVKKESWGEFLKETVVNISINGRTFTGTMTQYNSNIPSGKKRYTVKYSIKGVKTN